MILNTNQIQQISNLQVQLKVIIDLSTRGVQKQEYIDNFIQNSIQEGKKILEELEKSFIS